MDTRTDRTEETQMESTSPDAANVADSSPSSSPIIETFDLGFPWPTIDPFIVTVHHVDHFPAGNPEMGPATTNGVRGRDEKPSVGSWGWYYGDVVPGFPRHPHRGFETVTFVRRGTIDHADSLGATARYGSGDVQWLTAGRGIQHAEMMPLLDERDPNPLELFQIWLNLPAADKMADPSFTMLWSEALPRTQLKDDNGRLTEVTIVAGQFGDVLALSAPVHSWASRSEAEVAIWQFVAEASSTWSLPPTAQTETVRTMYVVEGSVEIAGTIFEAPVGVVLDGRETVEVTAGSRGAETLILQGRSIGEPVAMGGPFVMNEPAEIDEAYRDYRRTSFGGWPWPTDAPVHPREAQRFAKHPDGKAEFPEGDPR